MSTEMDDADTEKTALSGTVFGARLERWLAEPQPILRLEIVRIAAPLAILGFMTSRIAHADEWLGDAGFRVPDLGTGDYRQPLFIPAAPEWAAWSIAILLVASGLAVAIGVRARHAAIVFALTTAFVALSDRLSAFSVSKMAPVIAIALALSPCGSRIGLDAWLTSRRQKKNSTSNSKSKSKSKLPTHVVSGSVRFLQLLVPVIYCASGIAKIRGDWLHHGHVLWTHLHDSYQTSVALALANILPASAWTVLQAITLGFETLAPLWFAIPRTRTGALIVGVGMHTMIGLMFGPVVWFALLMATLLISAFLPDRFLDRAAQRLKKYSL